MNYNFTRTNMNRTIKNAAIIFAVAGCLTYAKAQKIAHVSLDSLIMIMPETKLATDATQNYKKGIEQEIVTMQTEFEAKYKDYIEKKPTMSQPVMQNKEQDLQQLQQRIEAFKQQANQDIQMKYAELTSPILDKARKAIDAVAKEGGYKYVLDTSPNNGSVLYSEPADDIFAAVKKKLESMPAANIPGAEGKKAPVKGGGLPPKGK